MDGSGSFRRGVLAIAPLWLGVVPSRSSTRCSRASAGLSLVETQALSVLVFAGSAQVSAVGLFGRARPRSRSSRRRSSSTSATCSTASRSAAGSRSRAGGARCGVLPHGRGVRRRLRSGERTFAFLLGAELSLFVAWNLATRRRDRGRGDPRPEASSASTSSSRSRSSPARAARPHARRARRRRRLGRARLRCSRATSPAGFRSSSRGIVGSLLGAELTAAARATRSGSRTRCGRSHDLLADGRRDGRCDVRLALRRAGAAAPSCPTSGSGSSTSFRSPSSPRSSRRRSKATTARGRSGFAGAGVAPWSRGGPGTSASRSPPGWSPSGLRSVLGHAVAGSPSSQRIRSRWIAARSSSSSRPPTRSATERRSPPAIDDPRLRVRVAVGRDHARLLTPPHRRRDEIVRPRACAVPMCLRISRSSPASVMPWIQRFGISAFFQRATDGGTRRPLRQPAGSPDASPASSISPTTRSKPARNSSQAASRHAGQRSRFDGKCR